MGFPYWEKSQTILRLASVKITRSNPTNQNSQSRCNTHAWRHDFAALNDMKRSSAAGAGRPGSAGGSGAAAVKALRRHRSAPPRKSLVQRAQDAAKPQRFRARAGMGALEQQEALRHMLRAGTCAAETTAEQVSEPWRPWRASIAAHHTRHGTNKQKIKAMKEKASAGKRKAQHEKRKVCKALPFRCRFARHQHPCAGPFAAAVV